MGHSVDVLNSKASFWGLVSMGCREVIRPLRPPLSETKSLSEMSQNTPKKKKKKCGGPKHLKVDLVVVIS
jgi:hypothetical protein